MNALAAVVLAAGEGRRLRPLTEERPKALCPVGADTLLDRTLARVHHLAGLLGPGDVAVNAHHLAGQLTAAVDGRAHLSREVPVALGTAGAIGLLRPWLAGRAALVANADAYLVGDCCALLAGWDGERVRLLAVRDDTGCGDFGPWRFAGLSLLPAADAAGLPAVPAGLYETAWRPALAEGRCDLVPFTGTFIDCGTPEDYLAANLHSSGGRSVVGVGAEVAGELIRSVVWPGGTVAAGERLVDSVRTTDGCTVHTGR